MARSRWVFAPYMLEEFKVWLDKIDFLQDFMTPSMRKTIQWLEARRKLYNAIDSGRTTIATLNAPGRARADLEIQIAAAKAKIEGRLVDTLVLSKFEKASILADMLVPIVCAAVDKRLAERGVM